MRHRRGSLGLVLLAVAVACASACAKQSEGERCDKLSGDDDCDTGLVCTSLQKSTSSGSSSTGGQTGQGELLPAVCCPPQGQRATVQACTANALTGPEEPADAATGGAGGEGGQAGGGGESGQGGSSGEGGSGGSTDTGGSSGSSDTGGAANLDASVDAGPEKG